MTSKNRGVSLVRNGTCDEDQKINRFPFNEKIKRPEKSSKYDYTIIFLGSTGSGKSSMLNSFMNFFEERTNDLILASAVDDKSLLDRRFFDSSIRRSNTSSYRCTESNIYIKAIYKEKKILLIDTPGFKEDLNNSLDQEDERLLKNIIKDITELNVKIIIYTQKSPDKNISNSVKKSLEYLKNNIPEEKKCDAVLVYTFYSGSIEFKEKNCIPFNIIMQTKIENNVYNARVMKPNKKLELWTKISTKVQKIVEFFAKDTQGLSVAEPASIEIPNSEKKEKDFSEKKTEDQIILPEKPQRPTFNNKDRIEYREQGTNSFVYLSGINSSSKLLDSASVDQKSKIHEINKIPEKPKCVDAETQTSNLQELNSENICFSQYKSCLSVSSKIGKLNFKFGRTQNERIKNSRFK